MITLYVDTVIKYSLIEKDIFFTALRAMMNTTVHGGSVASAQWSSRRTILKTR